MTGRWVLAAVGGLAGFSFYLLSELWTQEVLPERLMLALVVVATAGFGGLLAMAGPLRLPVAALGAALSAAAAAALVTLAGLRFDSVEELMEAGHPILAGAVVAALPWPFWIAAQGPGWRHYPTLFGEAWGMAVRASSALFFLLLVWGLIFLSDAMLGLVGLDVIEDLIDIDPVPWIVSGAVFGLALAVMIELGDVLSPEIAVRLVRLLLPAVLLVVAVFVVAVPLQGFARLGGLSVGGTLLAMVVVSIFLVSAAVERSDEVAVRGPIMAGATRAMAAILVVPAALSAWAIWLRVADAGWTPPRLVAATAAVLGLLAGLAWLAAVLRGADWMARLRAANVWLTVAALAVAALWLTPVLNAERISARSQVDRYLSGDVDARTLDLSSLARWGRPGAAAIAGLETLAAGDPARADLAARLADRASWDYALPPPDEADQKADLAAILPVSPVTATARRADLLADLQAWDAGQILADCRRTLPDGAPGCVAVFADFWPETPGDEALVLSLADGGWLRTWGFAEMEGTWSSRAVIQEAGRGVPQGAAPGVIARLQAGPPVLRPAPLNTLDTGSGTVFLMP